MFSTGKKVQKLNGEKSFALKNKFVHVILKSGQHFWDS